MKTCNDQKVVDMDQNLVHISSKQIRSQWRKNKHQLFSLKEDTCHYCKEEIQPEEFTFDHIIPMSKGGDPLDPKNIISSCKTCNGLKGSKDYDYFVKNFKVIMGNYLKESVNRQIENNLSKESTVENVVDFLDFQNNSLILVKFFRNDKSLEYHCSKENIHHLEEIKAFLDAFKAKHGFFKKNIKIVYDLSLKRVYFKFTKKIVWKYQIDEAV